MDNYKIDVTGDDILSKKAGIVIVYNNQYVYGFLIPSKLQKNIREKFNKRVYGFENKKILKPRAYCAILTLMIKQIYLEQTTDSFNFQLDICNDFDGHGQNIINILRENLVNYNVFKDITVDNCLFVRHPKKSLVQKSAEKISKNEWEGIIKTSLNIGEIHTLITKKKYRK